MSVRQTGKPRVTQCVDCGIDVISTGRAGPPRKRCDLHRQTAGRDATIRALNRRRNSAILAGARRTHCFVCGVEFDLTDGRRGRKRRVSSRKRICGDPTCYRDWVWFRDLNIPPGTYDRLYREQDGCCALCEKPHPRLRLDHCHETGVVRGLLCNSCNGALGVLGDSVVGLKRAINYLERVA